MCAHRMRAEARRVGSARAARIPGPESGGQQHPTPTAHVDELQVRVLLDEAPDVDEVLLAGVVAAACSMGRMLSMLRIRHAVNFDETFVLTLARQPFHVIWTEVTHGEANSFLHYFLAAVVVRLTPGHALLMVRVLS